MNHAYLSRPLLTFTALLSLLLPLLFSCSNPADRRLEEADRLMYIDADSAYRHLQDIELRKNDEKRQTLLALLTAKAAHKSHRPVKGDSVLSRAVSFYQNRGDSIEMQSIFYYALALLEKGRSPEALAYFTISYDLAISNKDYYYAGLAARELAKLYDRLMILADHLKWAQTEKDCFIKAGRPIHSAWADLELVRAFNQNYMPDETLAVIDSIDNTVYHNFHDFRVNIDAAKATALSNKGRYKEAIDILENQAKNGIPLNSSQWYLLSYCLAHLGDYQSAVEANDSARLLSVTRRDSIRVALMDGRIYKMTGNFQKSSDTFDQFTELLLSEADRRTSQPHFATLASILRDKYSVEKELNKSISQRNNLLLVVIILLIIIVTGTVLWFLKQYDLYKHRLEFSGSQVEALIKEIQEIKESHESEANHKQHEGTTATLAILAPYLDVVNHAFKNLFKSTQLLNKIISERTYIKALADLRSDETFQKLENAVNDNCDGWMNKFDCIYPGLKESERRHVLLLFLGFRSSGVAVLMGQKNVTTVHTAKSRLKSMLMTVYTQEARTIMEQLGFKRNSPDTDPKS